MTFLLLPGIVAVGKSGREVDAEQVRQDFLKALEDHDHPVWDNLLFGSLTKGTDRTSGIFEIWERHPVDGEHDCRVCKDIRREYPHVIELIERKYQARQKILAAVDENT